MSPPCFHLGCLRHTRYPTLFFLLLLRALGVFHLLHTLLSDSALQGQQWILMQNPSPAPCNTLFYLIYRNTRVRLPYDLVFITLPPVLYFMSAFPGSFPDQNWIPYVQCSPFASSIIQPFVPGLLPTSHLFGFLVGKPKPST